MTFNFLLVQGDICLSETHLYTGAGISPSVDTVCLCMCMLQTKYRNLRRSLFQQTSVTTPKAQKEEDQSHSDRGAAQAVRGEPGGVLWCKFLLWESWKSLCPDLQIGGVFAEICKEFYKICIELQKLGCKFVLAFMNVYWTPIYMHKKSLVLKSIKFCSIFQWIPLFQKKTLHWIENREENTL